MAAYLQIEEEIAKRIESGEIAPGQRIPPERVFCDQLGVSRMTVRQALGRLEQRGLLVRQQGRGTFASQPKIRQSATVLRGFFEEMVGQGLVPTSRLLSVEERVAPQSLAQALELRLGETVYTITRVRSASTSPVVLERSSFPTRLVPVCSTWTSSTARSTGCWRSRSTPDRFARRNRWRRSRPNRGRPASSTSRSRAL